MLLMSSPSSPTLQQLHRLDKPSPDFHDQLCNILYGEEYVQCVPNLQNDDAVWLIDYLDTVLDDLDPPSPGFRKCLRALKTICGTRAILPSSYTTSSHRLNIGPEPFASGGYGDVYKGTLDGRRVCIKRVRVYIQDGPRKAARVFCQEAIMWKHLTHPNIVSLLGVTLTPFQLISNWMPGGDLPQYIKDNSDADRLGLLSGVASGLCYLHSCNVIHGDLKGPNILVDDSGHARIADFGLATVTQNLDSVQSAPCQRGYTARWAAPEVLIEGAYSKEADIFSFAMVMVEVFTGAIPFGGVSPIMAMFAITQGQRPPRPTHPTFTDKLWVSMQRCWDSEPHLRPEVSEILQVLRNPDIPTWKQLITHTLITDERISLITTIFSDRDQVEIVRRLEGDDAQAFVDKIDEELDNLPLETRRKCLLYLPKICGRQALIPNPLKIPLCYDPVDPPQYRGGSTDVWKGKHDGHEVAAKVSRIHRTSDFNRITKLFYKEVVVWRHLRHPNVLPLLGVTVTGNRLVMVSEWMENGNINQFLEYKPYCNRLALLRDVTEGLIYLHTQGVIHGNVKGANILVNNNARACLTDFTNLSSPAILSDQSSNASNPSDASEVKPHGSIRWMSPELIDPGIFSLKGGRPTRASDCYALGMAIYEVLSRKAPFAPQNDFIIMRKILGGERPKKPQGQGGKWLPESIWGILEDCWEHQPDDRPSLNTVLSVLQVAAQQWALSSIYSTSDESVDELTPRPSVYSTYYELVNVLTDSDDETDVSTASESGSSTTRRSMTTDSISSTVHGDDEPPASPLGSYITTLGPVIPQNEDQLLDPPQAGNPEGGWIGGLLAGIAWKMVNAVTSKFHVL